MNKIIIILFLLNLSLFSKGINIDIATSSFKDSTGLKQNIELQLSFPAKEINFNFNNEDSVFFASVFFKLQIKDKLNNIVVTDNWQTQALAKDYEQIVNSQVFEIKKYLLDAGKYQVRIAYVDEADTASNGMIDFKAELKQFGASNPISSDIIICHIAQENTFSTYDAKYIRDKYLVIPNPGTEIYSNDPMLNAYFELYNFDKIKEDTYFIKYEITDGARNEVVGIESQEDSKEPINKKIVSIPVNIIPTGTYYLNIYYKSQQDSKWNSLSTKKFFINNPEMPSQLTTMFRESINFEESEWASLNDDETDIEYLQTKHLMTPAQKEEYESLGTTKAKQRALFKFWFALDPDTTTRVNEFRRDFLQRVDYANTYFVFGSNTQGWRTDRGRVLMRYGFPTNREEYPARDGKRACEIWFYGELQGGVAFFFVDDIGFGNFFLVHTTALGELQNPNWVENFNPAIDERTQRTYQNQNLNLQDRGGAR